MEDKKDGINVTLHEPELEKLRAGYDSEVMTGLLGRGLPGLDADTTTYVKAIRKQFYKRAHQRMRPQDRERVLIGVLVSRDAGLNLALHVYSGLMEGLSPHDVADIIFLSGIYTGVDCISDGLDAVTRTLDVLSQLADEDRCTVLDVVGQLRAAFKPPRYLISPPPPRSS
jgi:hypothetical protein